MGWGRNSLGKQRDEGRPSSPNRVVVVMLLLVDLTHTRPSSLQQLPTCLSFLSLFLSPSGALQKELYRREWRAAAAASWASGVHGSSRQERRGERKRERERERERRKSTTVDPLTAQCPPPSPHLLRALSGGVPAIGPT